MKRIFKILFIGPPIILLTVIIAGYFFISGIDDITEVKYSNSSTSVQVPFDRLVLVRCGSHMGAFKILRRVSHWGFLNGVKYEYWYRDDGKHDFASPETKHGKGIVFERYRQVRQLGPNSYKVEDVGSRLNIQIGKLWVEWSGSNHIYTRPYIRPKDAVQVPLSVEVSASPWVNVDQVDFNSQRLKWIGACDRRKYQPAFQPPPNISLEKDATQNVAPLKLTVRPMDKSI